MKLYLIRHAESANNAIVTGRGDWSARVPDPELTERGHQQAQLLAEHLTDPAGETRQHPILAGESGTLSFGLTHLYCSLMTRSILTAQYIAGTCAVRAVAHPDIFEKGGIYHESADGTKTGAPGPGRAYFRERFPALELPDSVDEDGWYNRDYETEEPFLWRIAHVLKDIRRRHALSQDRVAMVVHGDFIDQFLNEVTGFARRPENYHSIWEGNWGLHNTSITRIDFLSGAEVVVYTNRLDHLPASLLSW